MKLRFHRIAWILAFFASASCAQTALQAGSETPQKTTVCELLRDPKAWDHKLIQVTGLASHGFEDSGFSDPACNGRYGGLWMSYGGTKITQTPSTVNEIGEPRKKPLVVEGIVVPLVKDELFRQFDRLLHQPNAKGRVDNIVHATVVARFFAGRLQHYPGGDAWSGFGHMGCCSLFVIQQVVAVEGRPEVDLDPSDTPDQPNRYPFCDLTPVDNQANLLKAQQQAEAAVEFRDAQQVATEFLLSATRAKDPSALKLHLASSSVGRVNYEATVPGSHAVYLVVVSRPAWLSYYAKDPGKIAWLVIAAYAIGDEKVPGCGGVTSVLKE